MAKRAAPSSPETGQSDKDHLTPKKFKAEIRSPSSHELEQLGLPVNDTPLSGLSLADDAESWTKVEKRKAKKARKIETKVAATSPRFFYVNSEIVKRREAVGISDIRDLVLHLFGDASPQPWVKVENRSAIKKVVALFVPGITPSDLQLPPGPSSATVSPNVPIAIPVPQSDAPSVTSLVQDSAIPLLSSIARNANSLLFPSKFNLPTPGLPAFALPSNASPRLPAQPSSQLQKHSLPFLARTFSHVIPTRAPGDSARMYSVLHAFLNVPIRGGKGAKISSKLNSAPSDSLFFYFRSASIVLAPEQHILTPEQMAENGYPFAQAPVPVGISTSATPSQPSQPNTASTSDGWVETPQRPNMPVNASSLLFALDCEMVQTSVGKALARVCVVEYDSECVVYDKLVKPDAPVVDYLTQWSGITAEMLENVSTSLSDVQKDLLGLLAVPASSQDTPILIGHSLESDLFALKLRHNRCLDTALLYEHPRGRGSGMKPGLAWLIKKWCGREIRTKRVVDGKEVLGHDPEEDARACIELVKKKLANGPSFGEFGISTESLFERLSRVTIPQRDTRAQNQISRSIRTAFIDRCSSLNAQETVVDSNSTSAFNTGPEAKDNAVAARTPSGAMALHFRHATTAQSCTSDQEVLKRILWALNDQLDTKSGAESDDERRGHDFIFARFCDVADRLGWTNSAQRHAAVAQGFTTSCSPESVHEQLTLLNARLQIIYEQLSSNSALIIFTGHDDPQEMASLGRRRTEFESIMKSKPTTGPGFDASQQDGPLAIKWTNADARALEEAVEKAKKGLLFLCMKA